LKKVYIGSANPVKIKCTEYAFNDVFRDNQAFDFIGISVPSGVSDQPMTDQETLSGAENRAKQLMTEFHDGDFFVGIEGGIEQNESETEAFAWVVILNKNMLGRARTATFQLPPKITELISQGVELGHADDMVFNRTNSKQGNGAVGILTNNIIDRIEYYRPAVVLALIPFINQSLYYEKNG
jgi:inosine/xanthosine triphosphatase